MLFDGIMEALERIGQRQEEILATLADLRARLPEADISAQENCADKWLQDGIDSIMSYQVGKRREAEQ